MQRRLNFVKYWLPLLLWFVLIFAASGDTNSFRHSSRIIGPIINWLLPHLSAARVEEIIFFVRKCAHGTEYAVLAWLFWRAFRHMIAVPARTWSSRAARLAWLSATSYAATDELHQCFVPNRQGSIWDVVIDACGAALGLAIIWSIGRLRKFW